MVRQDFSAAVRAVFFQTELDEFQYATDGGTLFIVSFQGRYYGLTCKHVLRNFKPGKLFITQDKYGKKGSKPAPVAGITYPSAPTGAATETDVVDICVVTFADDIAPDFFGDSAYIIDSKTVGTSKSGHELHIAGILKDKSWIIEPDPVAWTTEPLGLVGNSAAPHSSDYAACGGCCGCGHVDNAPALSKRSVMSTTVSPLSSKPSRQTVIGGRFPSAW